MISNAEQFQQLFGFTATELWAMTEEQFTAWLKDEAPELRIKVRPMANSEILRRLHKEG